MKNRQHNFEYRENDNIDYQARKQYADMSLEELQTLLAEAESRARADIAAAKAPSTHEEPLYMVLD